MVTYPKPIESMQLLEREDESGFTASEKIALRNAWSVIKANQKRHATEIFTRFFVQNSSYLKWFKTSETKFDNEQLHAHPHWVLESIGTLIEEGLWDVTKLNVILSSLIKVHSNIKLNGEDIGAMTNVMNIYLKEVLARYMSPTLDEALKKLTNKFTENYEQDYDEMD